MKWITAYSKRGYRRTFAAMNNFAIVVAYNEGLPFTVLNSCNVPGNHVTHNYKG